MAEQIQAALIPTRAARGIISTILRSSPARVGMHPDLRLEGSLGDRYEIDKEHIVDVHESTTDLPPIFGRFFRSDLLRCTREQM